MAADFTSQQAVFLDHMSLDERMAASFGNCDTSKFLDRPTESVG
jgi:hypothetical protein